MINMAHAPSLQLQHAFLNSSLINSQAASNNYPLINPQRTLINPQLSSITPPFHTNTMPGLRSRPLIDRRLRSMGASSSESNSLQSSQSISSSDEGRSGYRHMILHIFTRRMILDVIAFIWRLPGMIGGLLKKEEKLLDTIEDDINEATDVVKMGSRVVEELAEGVEKVADAIDNKDLEKIAKVVEEDAKRVEVIMDKVKARTKVVHDELEEVASSLGESMQDVEEVVAKVQVKPRDASMQEAAKLLAVLPSSSTPTSHLTGAQIEHHSPLANLIKFWQAKYFFINVHAIASCIQPFFVCNHNYRMSSFNFTTLVKALTIVSILMYLVNPLPPLRLLS